jgi:hypothetical protein
VKTKQRVREDEDAPKKRKYYKPDIEAVREKMSQLATRRSKGWKSTEGKNLIRILPPWSKAGQWFKEAMNHYVPDGKGKKKMIGCPTLNGERCAICERRAKFHESNSIAKQKMAEALTPAISFHVNMVDLKNADKGVQTGRLTEKIINDLLEYFVDPEWGDFTSPKRGHNMIFVREGDGMQSRYSIKPQRNPSSLEDMEWLEQIKNLDKAYPTATYGETRALLKELDADDEDDEDDDDGDEEDDAPRSRRPGKKRRAAKDDEDEDETGDEEDEEEDADEEEEDETPPRKKKAKSVKKKRRVVEEDDEEEDDE